MESKTTSEQLDALQGEVAFQGQSLLELNDALVLQQQDILLLKRQLALMGKAMNEMRGERTPATGEGDNSEIPPHY